MAGVHDLDPGAESAQVPERRRPADGRADLAKTVLARRCGGAAAAEAAPRAPAQGRERPAAAAGPLPRPARPHEVQVRLPAREAADKRTGADLQRARGTDGDAHQGQAQRAGPDLGPLQRREPERQPSSHAGGAALQRRRPAALPLPHHRGAA